MGKRLHYINKSWIFKWKRDVVAYPVGNASPYWICGEKLLSHIARVSMTWRHIFFFESNLAMRHEMEGMHTSWCTIAMAKGLSSTIPLPWMETVTGRLLWMGDMGTPFLIINLWGVEKAPREGSSVRHAVSMGTAMSRTPVSRTHGSGKAFPSWDSGRWQSLPRGEC